MNPLPLNTAILFIIFNRPDTTQEVFNAIRDARPPRLYVAADGAREGRAGEAERVGHVRQIATAVDWPCEVRTLFRDKNLGCKHAVSSALNWFFENESCGIVLEDDCLPHPDFFTFCEASLERYAKNETIMAITGNNFQDGQVRGDGSYYYSRLAHVWGWASWCRAWQHYDVDMQKWPSWKKTSEWRNFWKQKSATSYWSNVFDRTHSGLIDTWDYQWTASIWMRGGLAVTPNVNLVSNIGFGPDATHTVVSDDVNSKRRVEGIGILKPPSKIVPDHEADDYVMKAQFSGKLNHLILVSWGQINWLFSRLKSIFVIRVKKGRLHEGM
jgi:hypothetical protein